MGIDDEYTTDVLILKCLLKLVWCPYLAHLVLVDNCPDGDALMNAADGELFNFDIRDDVNGLPQNIGDGAAAQGGGRTNYEPPIFFPFHEMPPALKPRPSHFPNLRKVVR